MKEYWTLYFMIDLRPVFAQYALYIGFDFGWDAYVDGKVRLAGRTLSFIHQNHNQSRLCVVPPPIIIVSPLP